MAETLKKILGVVVLVLSVGGVSCDALYSAWTGDVVRVLSR